MTNGTDQIAAAGQSIWLDTISRDLLRSGRLKHYIENLHVTGVTSNPSILQAAIVGSEDYDEALAMQIANGVRDPEQLVFALALEDITAAADLLRPIFDASGGVDGYVSIEVSPTLAHDAEGTIAAGRSLFAQADRPNVLIKVPGTAAGVAAIEQLITEGVPVNATLLFDSAGYEAAAEAYLRGLERRVAAGHPLVVGSVASVFVSRWASAVDAKVSKEMAGMAALAEMQLCYSAFERVCQSPRFTRLAASGALPQRLLFASTSTKNPDLPDTYYVGKLAASGTIDTIPEKTLLAVADHGYVCELLQSDGGKARATLDAVAEQGVDLPALALTLQQQGAEAFSKSWASLLEDVSTKTHTLATAV